MERRIRTGMFVRPIGDDCEAADLLDPSASVLHVRDGVRQADFGRTQDSRLDGLSLSRPTDIFQKEAVLGGLPNIVVRILKYKKRQPQKRSNNGDCR